MTEVLGKVGSKGELYLPVKIRKLLNLTASTKIRYMVSPNGYLLVERITSIEDLLSQPRIAKISIEEFEKFSEETQERLIEGRKGETV